MLDPIKKILVQRADRVGDVILALPAIESLHRVYPDAEIHFLTSIIGKRCVEGHPLLSHILVAEFANTALSNEDLLLDRLQDESYDCYIALWDNLPLAKLAKKAGIKMRVGDSSQLLTRFFYTHKSHPNWGDITRHQVEFNHDILMPLGVPAQLVSSELPISDAAEDKAQIFFKKWINPERKVVVICASTGGSNQPIPEKALIDFMEALNKLNTYTIILDGQVPSSSLLSNYQDTHVHNVMGQLSLQELAAVIKRAHFYVGPDTGPTHMASFLGIPSLIFSSRKSNPPSHWGSLSPFSIYIRRDFDCEFFCSKGCHPSECFRFVTGDLLMEKFGELVYQKEMHEGRSMTEQKNYLTLLTLRVLYPVVSLEAYEAVCSIAEELREEGLFIFPVILPSWSLWHIKHLIALVIRYNINTIQGPIPFWMVGLIRLYMGAVAVYVKPTHVHFPLYPGVPAQDLCRLYRREHANA